MKQDQLIALEVHDASLWEPTRILPLLPIMQRWGYNALVLHQNDLLDVTTQLGLSANYGVTDLRLKKVRSATAWLNRLCAELDKIGAQLFLEIKEPSFHDYALEFFPDLIGPDGHADPLHPDWPKFCAAKTKDILKRVPKLGGLIVNLSSPESRVSLPDYLATHQHQDDPLGDWFDRMIDAFAAPLLAQGKSLWVRDFSYTDDMQSAVLQAIDRRKGDIGASVKITAHDYFPEHPQNKAAAHIQSPVMFEFEAFGEHMGWGVIPNCRVAECQIRMQGYRDLTAAGLLLRISWEAITGANAMDSLSAVNVFALPKLAQSDHDPTQLICEWLADVYDTRGELAEHTAQLLLDSWHIPAAAYWDGEVFPRHSCLPSTWQEGWLSMATKGMGRRDRDLGLRSDDTRWTEHYREALFAQKESSTAHAIALADQAKALRLKLPARLGQHMQAFDWLPLFARQFEWAIKATYFAARDHADDQKQLQECAGQLLAIADELATRLSAEKSLPHHHQVLFDPKQIRGFVTSLGV